MGFSSVTQFAPSSSPPPNSSTESINGLKFGQKIYFEDGGMGGASSSSGGTPPKKARSGVVQGAQPPRCQVEGCKVDLSDAKAYYSRHKVCGLHSKSPKVIVAGLEQRFCQQCSRFHQLPEFDQEKRSCRRRLAGHNERRRKPPPGSLLTSRYGGLSSSIFADSNSRVGGYMMDFAAYSKLAGRDAWSIPRSSEQLPGSQSTDATGKFFPVPWLNSSENSPSDLMLQGSVGGTSFASGPRIPPGECFTGVTDSSCALSLLSSQPWGSRNRAPPSLGVNDFMNVEGAPTTELATSHPHQLPSTAWGFKGNEVRGSSHQFVPNVGQLSQPVGAHHSSGELELLQHSSRRQFFEESAQDMHWSL